MTVEELPDDEAMSAMVQRFLTEPAFADKMREEEPAFAAYVEQHEEALAAAASDMEDLAADFAEIQAANAKIASTAVGEPIPDDIMKELIPGWGTFSTEKLDPSKFGFLKVLNDDAWVRKHPREAEALKGHMQTLKELDPALLRQFGALSPKELEAAGLLGGKDGPRFEAFIDAKRSAARIAKLDPTDLDGILGEIFGSKKAGYISKNLDGLLKAELAKV